ncbi:MAG: hypothetical protein HQ554_01505 [FCB group bacterium]|nr:hypothetical protein [FCB group bacterium]
MARSNYTYEKRQKELAKKKKKEAKRLKKLNRAAGIEDDVEVINEDEENADNESKTTEDSH